MSGVRPGGARRARDDRAGLHPAVRRRRDGRLLPSSGLVQNHRDMTYTPDVTWWSLPNGLTVMFAPDPQTNVVRVDLRVMVGAGDEPPGKSGLAHLVEHMMFNQRARFAAQIQLVLGFAASSPRAPARAARAVVQEILARRLELIRTQLGASYGIEVEYDRPGPPGRAHGRRARRPRRRPASGARGGGYLGRTLPRRAGNGPLTPATAAGRATATS